MSPSRWQRMARKSTSDESTTLSTESLTESLCEEEVSYVLKHLDMTMEDLGKIANVVGGKIFGSTISNIVDTVGTKFTKFSLWSLWMKSDDFQTPCIFFANNNLMHFWGLVCKKILVEENAQKWLKS